MRLVAPGLRLLLWVTLLGSLLSCELDEAAALDGRVFLLQSADGFRPVRDTTVRLGFRAGKLSLGAGCNSIFGSFEIRDSLLITGELGATETDCDSALASQDEWLKSFFSAQPALTLVGERLTLKGELAELVFVSREVAQPDRELVGTVWSVDTFLEGGAVSNIFLDPGPTMVFAEDQSVRIDTTCNTATGRYTVGKDRLTVSGLTFSSKVCTGAAKSADAHLRKLLKAGMLTVEIEGGRLTLGNDSLGISATAGDSSALQ